jgi:hypothetical protein
MGVNEGFDIYLALNSSCQDLYDHFLEEILQKYKDAIHPVTQELKTPTSTSNSARAR